MAIFPFKDTERNCDKSRLLRVPCLIQGPGIPAGQVIDDPVGTIDVLATAADISGIETSQIHGKSWRPLWDKTQTRDFALSEYEVDAQRSAVDMDLIAVRSARYRMSVDLKTDTGELYDMHDDPDEMINLFDDPSKMPVRREHMDMIQSRPDDIIPAAERVGWH